MIIWIAILTFLLRSLPGILRIRSHSSDEQYHFMCAERIRENRFRYPERLRGFLLPGLYDYPPLFHYFLALFPRAKREQLAPFVSALIDTVHVIVIYFFTLYLFRLPQFSLDATAASWIASTAALLFATSPALLYYGTGPRAFSATPRALGELFITATLLLGLIFYCQGNYLILFLAGLFAALTLLTSTFGGQVLVFFSIGLAAFLRAPLLLALPVLGIIFALALSKGYYWRVLVGGIKHSIFIQKVSGKKFSLITGRNKLVHFKNIVSSGMKRDFVGFATSLGNLIYNNTYIILVSRNVMLFILLFLGIGYWQMLTLDNATIFLGSWIAISLVIFLLTSLKPFLFLGEAERYVEHSIPAQVILLSFLLTSLTSPAMLIVVLSYHGLFYLANIFSIHRRYTQNSLDRSCKEALFNWLIAEAITGRRVLGIPDSDHYEIVYRTDNEVLVPPAKYTLITEDLWEDIWEEVAWPNKNLQRVIEDYNLDLLIVNKKQQDYALKRGWCYDLSPYAKVYENDVYTVYQTAQISEDSLADI